MKLNRDLPINRLKGVIFDMDGVLVDTEPVYYQVEHYLFKSLGLKISKTDHHSFVGLSMKTIWTRLKSENQLDLTIEALISLHKKAMIKGFKALENPQPIPGITDLLELLSSNQLKIALASSSSHELIDVILKSTGLEKYFDVIVSGDEVEQGKPAPDIFLKTLGLLGLEQPEVMIIEDSTNGILAAQQAGIFTVAYRNFNSGAQDLSQADLIIDDFEQYIALLQKNLQPGN